MNSDNGETIPLDRPVNCIGGVEVWLIFLLVLHSIKLKQLTYYIYNYCIWAYDVFNF